MLRRGRKLFEKSFSSPIPPSFKNFETWGLIFCHNFCARPSNAHCSHCTNTGKFCSSFFKSLRVWAEPIKTAFSFCQAFSLRLLCQRKSGIMGFYVFFVGKGNLLKEAFLSPHPYPSRTLKLGDLFFCHNFCAQPLNTLCSHCIKE